MTFVRNLQGLFRLHRVRLREHRVSALLTILGIAVGVALVFAVLVANTSITGSLGTLNEEIAGSATLELAAHTPDGFDAKLLRRAEALPSVEKVAPLIERRAAVRAGGRGAAVTFVGIDERVPALGGSLLQGYGASSLFDFRGLALTAPLADRLGVREGQEVTLSLGARDVRAPVLIAFDTGDIGRLVDASIATAPLGFAQDVAGLDGRLTRVLIAPVAGRERDAVRELRAIAGPGVSVRASNSEFRLVEQAAELYNQSTAGFAAIGALVGFLFALNAMLLGAPERRRFIAYIRMRGCGDRTIIQLLLLEGLTLGLAASILGVLAGDQLLRHVIDPSPGYLAFAFPVANDRVVTIDSVAIAVAAGIGSALLASMLPLVEVFSRRPIDAPYREREEFRTRLLATPTLLAIAAALFVASLLILIFASAPAIIGTVLVVAAMLAAIPALLRPTLDLLQRLSFRTRFPMLVVAVGELRTSIVRSAALAATAALAVFGCVQTGGARQDLLRGLDNTFESFVATADVWVTAGGDENALTTNQFTPTPGQLAALRDDDAVADVRPYRGGFVDLGDRRAWVIARSPEEPQPIPAEQLVQGDLGEANSRLRAGGWTAISQTLANRMGATIGDPITLPTPSGPARWRLAATVTNFGWAPGAVVLNADDYANRWRTAAVAALEVDLAAGVVPEEGTVAIERVLGPGSSLTVETAVQRADRFQRLARDGLDRLSQIFALLLVASVLALAAAMGAVLWQRRPRIAAARAHGYPANQLWRSLVLETGTLLGIGCVIGALGGLYGQAFLVRTLESATGFPLEYSPAILLALAIMLGIAMTATAVVALPSYLAARVPPGVGFQESVSRAS